MIYKKLKRVCSHNKYSFLPKFIETFPELKNIEYEELCKRWQSLNIDFYTEEKTKVKFWIRLTLPFALILMLFMLLALPFVFIITGTWGYDLGEKNRILNWLRQLKLL
jgi:lipopolysaccharide export LptBFGC system permease protein LptF